MSDSKKFAYCGSKSGSGFLCILREGHDGEHLSIDNTRLWKGTPGAPVRWANEKVVTPAPKKEDPTAPVIRARDPTAMDETVVPPQRPTGDACTTCGQMKVVRESSCRTRCMACGTIDGGCG